MLGYAVANLLTSVLVGPLSALAAAVLYFELLRLHGEAADASGAVAPAPAAAAGPEAPLPSAPAGDAPGAAPDTRPPAPGA